MSSTPRPRLIAAVLAVFLAGCASTRLGDDERLALYRAHAGEPVRDFQYFNQLTGWASLGASALAVWTRPREAWLLELSGPCPDLDVAPAISLTNQLGRVSARFDRVQVIGGPATIRIPCRIQTIRPLDAASIRSSERELREARTQERDAAAGDGR